MIRGACSLAILLVLFALSFSAAPAVAQTSASISGPCVNGFAWYARHDPPGAPYVSYQACDVDYDPPSTLAFQCSKDDTHLVATVDYVPGSPARSNQRLPVNIQVDGELRGAFLGKLVTGGMYEYLEFPLNAYDSLFSFLAAGDNGSISIGSKNQPIHLIGSRKALEFLTARCVGGRHALAQANQRLAVSAQPRSASAASGARTVKFTQTRRQLRGSCGRLLAPARASLRSLTVEIPEKRSFHVGEAIPLKISGFQPGVSSKLLTGLHVLVPKVFGIDGVVFDRHTAPDANGDFSIHHPATKGQGAAVYLHDWQQGESETLKLTAFEPGTYKIKLLVASTSGLPWGFGKRKCPASQLSQAVTFEVTITPRPAPPRLAQPARCHLAAMDPKITVRDVDVFRSPSVAKPIEIGQATELSWSLKRQLNKDCRTPLYLMVTAPNKTRFEGEGFLAIPKGQPGPFDIKHDIGKTRLFFPLHLLERRRGTFKVKSYEVGPLNLRWSLVEVPRLVESPEKRTHFDLGREVVAPGGELNAVARYKVGEPRIVVRDNFTLDEPTKIIRSNSGEFELHVFKTFYRVLDARSGELVAERAGIDPNFSPGSRFLAAFVEAGQSINILSDAAMHTLELLDLYTGHVATAGTAAYLSWAHGDAFFAPGGYECISNSCSAEVAFESSIVDRPILKLEKLNTYKNWITNFEISLSLESGTIVIRDMIRRLGENYHDGGRAWQSLLNPSNNSNAVVNAAEKKHKCANMTSFVISEKQKRCYGKLNTRAKAELDKLYALLPGDKPTQQAEADGKLYWRSSQGTFRLSHYCEPNPDLRCKRDAEWQNDMKPLWVTHTGGPAMQRQKPPRADLAVADARLRSTRAGQTIRETAKEPSSTRDATLRRRVEALLFQSGTQGDLADQAFETVQTRSRSNNYEANLRATYANVIRHIRRRSSSAANLLPSLSEVMEYAQRTTNGCLTENEPDIPLLTQAGKLYHSRTPAANAWLFRTECDYGATSRFFGWLVANSSAGGAVLVNLNEELKKYIGSTGTQRSSEGRLIHAEANYWPQAMNRVGIVEDRFFVADGTWPGGRWALVFDLATRKVKTFIRNVENADDFSELALTNDGRTLIQLNKNGQLFFYDTATGKVVLRGVETDDELIIYDDNGYYLSSPEGSQFLNLKFPGIPGYSSVAQFATTLNRPDAIKAILAGRPPLPKPNLTAPPDLRISTTVSGTGRARQATLKYETGSEVGLTELIVFIDGRPERRVPLSGERTTGQVTVGLPAEARWISAVTVDRSGYRSIARGQGLPDVAKPDSSRLFTITVGTDVYDDPGISRLGAAKRDAASFGELVSSVKGGLYSDVDLTPFLDERGLKAKLLGRLRDVVAEAGPQDTIMLFAAAHGDQGPDGKFYLVTRDTEKANLENTAIAWDDIAAALKGVKARVVVFLDACRSGAAGQATGTNDDAVAALLSRDAPITVIAASKGRQNSEETSLGGYFTNEIIRAVAVERAKTDTNGNGAIELAELYGAIKPRVVAATANNGDTNKQTPWIARNQMVGEIPLF